MLVVYIYTLYSPTVYSGIALFKKGTWPVMPS